jgi:nucleotide-binding universal stress UspA family protein
VFRRILVAYDGSEGARRALSMAAELARTDRAELVALGVEAHLPHYGATVGEVEEEHRFEEQEERRLLAEAAAYAEEQGLELIQEIRAGHPAQTIVHVAKEKAADLIVVGHSGHSGVWGLFLGGTAEKVSRHAPCSVLIVR